jgi:PhnB protein
MKEINAYLNFDGNCREAMSFYQRCFGAELQVMLFSDAKGQCEFPPGAEDKVMHARLTKGSVVLMASDTMPGMPLTPGNNVHLTIHCETLHEIQSLFAALGDNGTITMPLQDTFWGAHFGMLTDRFGVHWMLNFEKPKPA